MEGGGQYAGRLGQDVGTVGQEVGIVDDIELCVEDELDDVAVVDGSISLLLLGAVVVWLELEMDDVTRVSIDPPEEVRVVDVGSDKLVISLDD